MGFTNVDSEVLQLYFHSHSASSAGEFSPICFTESGLRIDYNRRESLVERMSAFLRLEISWSLHCCARRTIQLMPSI